MNVKKIIIVFFILLFQIPVVYAHSAAGGNTAGYGSCATSCTGGPCEWCYSNIGLRFSLYRYEADSLIYYGSEDYSTSNGSLNGRTALISTASSGKVAYKTGKSSMSWSSGYYKLDIKNGSSSFSCFFGSSCGDFKKSQIESYFKISGSSPKAEDVRDKINSFFGTSITTSDLSYLYITVEPTMYIYDRGGDSYYGTIYELLSLSFTKNGQYLKGLNEVLYYTFPTSIYAASPTGTDKNKFVGSNTNYKVVVLGNYKGSLKTGYHNSTDDRKYNRNAIVGNSGYGIGVFWLGDYVKTDCKSVCGSNNISCAADWCESKSSTSAQKEACVLACGVNKVNPSSCGTTSTPSASTSKCSVSRDSNKQTCVYDSNNYYKEECLESTTVKYSNDLPVTLTKQTGGFNYSARTSGVRACVLTFDTNYYNYKYYVTKNSERNAITQKKTNFENKGKNDNYNYKFEATDGITLYIDGKSYKLVQTENNTSEVTFQNRRYGLEKVYTTTNESLFELPQQCYSYENGKASLKAGCSNIKSYSKYYGFYSTNSAFEVPTKTVSLKAGSGLNDTNKCQYYNIEQIEQDVNCYTILNGSYSASGSYSGYIDYYIVNRGNATVTNCKLNGSNITCEDSTTDANKNNLYVSVAANQVKEIDASVTYWYNGQKITKSCPIKISGKPKTVVNKSCRVENPNPTAYDAIRKYCNENWKTDINGYTSYNDCYNRCSNRKKTCKTTVKCDDEEEVKKYCENSTNLSNDGYKSTDMCINDCSCKDTGGLEYLYRPIAVGGKVGEYNAFPNRQAGTNWYGYENLTLDDKFDEAPIYTIELNQETIRTLKNETGGNISNYVDYEGESDDGYYKSDLIDKYEGTIFTCKGGC